MFWLPAQPTRLLMFLYKLGIKSGKEQWDNSVFRMDNGDLYCWSPDATNWVLISKATEEDPT